ncbi:MAG: sulfatase-like hydrolase/transferase, partial [Anaerolineae bacterium]|nr:sulfatase-like hydrolase/transferase [Anaerolineae bacterium]
AFDWIRGQENDHYRSYPRQVTLPCQKHKLRMPDYTMVHYLRNISRRYAEADYFVAQTMRRAEEWLEENGREGPFFLWVDTFDPHEPWDPPRHYVDLYDPGYTGEEVIYPRYGFWEEYLSPEELHHCRALYHGEVTMVDHWVGRLLDRIDALGLRDDTVVIFTSDHGFLFGEHGIIGKSIITERGFEAVPFYQEIARVPLLIRAPGLEGGRRIPALVQSHDLMPTILELAGVIMTESVAGRANVQVLQCGMYKEREWHFDPASLHGASLLPLMRGEQERLRDYAICSASLTVPTPAFAKSAIIREDGWCLFYSGEVGASAEEVRLTRLGRSPICAPEDAVIPFAPELYYLPEDPHQEDNRIAERPDVARELHALHVEHLERVGTAEKVL